MIVREVIVSLYGAWRLIRLDASALAMFDASPAGARRSFLAAALVAPIFVLVMALLPPEAAAAGGYRWIAAETIAYATSWVAYPVIAEWLTWQLGCREKFEGYLCAYNWSMVLQNAVLLPLVVLTSLEVLPPEVQQLLWVAAIALIMAFLWFVARSALGVSAMTAAGLVVLDQLLSVVIDAIATAVS